MANILPMEKQIVCISNLCEGASIRAIERMTGVHHDTIMRLGVKVGEECKRMMNALMVDLDCSYVQIDELWGFVGKKAKHVTGAEERYAGDVWTWLAIDAEKKTIPSFHVSTAREKEDATAFLQDLSSRMKNRIQLSSDGLPAYYQSVKDTFGDKEVDYGQIVKTYSTAEAEIPGTARKYSPPEVVDIKRTWVFGFPLTKRISTSYSERQNLTMRMHARRLTRLTNAFSKKLENFKAAMGLTLGYYNFARKHMTLKTTPAVAAGILQKPLTVAELIEFAEIFQG